MQVELEFGSERLVLAVPETADVLTLSPAAPVADPALAIADALARPIGAPPLRDVIRARAAGKVDPRAVIVVSDNTRPVPYRGPAGILEPVLAALRAGGVRRIVVLVATGTHRSLTDAEMRAMFPESVFAGDVEVINHDCRDTASLVRLGQTGRGTETWINRRYMEADIRILTGLVEPHFMAGLSGGPKSICPGLVGEAATHVFHGAAMMGDPKAATLVLDGNPCQAESMDVARMAGSDFIVNVTIDRERRVTGVFAGELAAAHRAAAARAMEDAEIPMGHDYDVAVTHAGFVGINHYQAAKAAVEGVRALADGGTLILAANHTDVDPVGGPNYKRLLPIFTRVGPDEFERLIRAPEWSFVPDQWELQMWGRALRKLGRADRLIYCAPQLTGAAFAGLPGTDGGAGLTGLAGRALAEAMVQRAINAALAARPDARLAVLADGPYGVPRRVGCGVCGA